MRRLYRFLLELLLLFVCLFVDNDIEIGAGASSESGSVDTCCLKGNFMVLQDIFVVREFNISGIGNF